jgi:hypothetical protein
MPRPIALRVYEIAVDEYLPTSIAISINGRERGNIARNIQLTERSVAFPRFIS